MQGSQRYKMWRKNSNLCHELPLRWSGCWTHRWGLLRWPASHRAATTARRRADAPPGRSTCSPKTWFLLNVKQRMSTTVLHKSHEVQNNTRVNKWESRQQRWVFRSGELTRGRHGRGKECAASRVVHWNTGATKEKHTSHNLERVQCNLWCSVVSCPLYCGVQYSIHHGDFCIVED